VLARLLEGSEPPRRLTPQEQRVEFTVCAAVLAAGCATAYLLPWSTSPSAATVAACVLAYATTARVCLHLGGGSAAASQLAFVPMLFVLPPPLVPLTVAAALLASALPEVVSGRAHPERLASAVSDAGYAFGPALVFAAGSPATPVGDWEWLALAFASQCVLDAALSCAREWLGLGIRPSVHFDSMRTVYGVDLLLMPVAVVIADRAVGAPEAILVVLPLSVLLATVARDRNRRLDEATARFEEAERERARVNVAVHRVGRSLGDSLDRRTMLEVALGTAVDAVAADAGRARMAGSSDARVFDAVPVRPGAAEAEALLAAERAALAGHELVSESGDGWWAMGHPLFAQRELEPLPLGAIAVCRHGGPFSREQEDLFAYLATQTAASIEAIALHERLRERFVSDELTGLANHRRFHEFLKAEVEQAPIAGHPLSVLLVDIDNFRRVNAELGHGGGDEVLRAIAAVVREHCRTTDDQPARYAGQRFAIALPGANIDDAWTVAEDIRTGVAALGLVVGGAHVSVSVGLAELTARVASDEALIFAAEAALDEAKRAGKDRSMGFRGPYPADVARPFPPR
jgi:diguanylate cyclase (GGDEF)-like protein